jgi:RNA recognition motif-containing protein
MNKKLYVGSLPYATTEEELRDLFSQYGNVASVRIITDKFTGQSKGFGFVEMENDEDAQKAIEGMNGTQLGGRTLIVNNARPPQEREGGGGGRFERDERRSFRSRRGA